MRVTELSVYWGRSEVKLPTSATGDGPHTASGLIGVLDLGVEIALGGA
jgi:hypothetical protein